ncbi:MAG: LysR family transcriptional regulator [Bdellovibrionales bacterium]|nr:LysR family transcriptional regulator [Bdellovibrionales bacterium]
MDPWLNYHHLYYFKVIAQEGSIARAAEKLRLGQPTLSAQIRTLEGNLGITLFERKNKRMNLTEAGKLALDYAHEIFELGSELLEVLRDRKIPDRLHVELGALDSVPKHVISEMVKAAHRYGKCTVTLLEGSSKDLLRELLAHRIDLVLTNQIPESTEENPVFTRKIKECPVSIYGHPKFKAYQRKFPECLGGAPLVLPTRHSKLRFDLDAYFHSRNLTPDVAAETQDTALQKILGMEGIGMIPLTHFAAETHVKSKKLIRIGDLAGVEEVLYLVSAKRRIENPISNFLLKEFSNWTF